MNRIRSLRADDLPQVVSLYRNHLARRHVATHEELVTSFARIFLEAPLMDPSVPSLVCESADGNVVGFLGSQVHRMRFENRRMRLACSSSLVVAPHARRGGTGALMLRKYLAGPQELTITDTATGATEYMWKRLGGSLYPIGSIVWLHALRPVQTLVGLGLWQLGRHRWLPLFKPLCRPADMALSRRSAVGLPRGADNVTEEPLTPELMIEHLRLGPQTYRLWPDHDVDSLDRLFSELGRARARGRLVKGLVKDHGGSSVGWYIANLLPHDIWDVVHLAASPGNENLLFQHVLHKAQRLNAAAIKGRLEPWMVEVLPRWTLMFSRARFLFHTRDEAIRAAVLRGETLLTGLEGDTWMPR